MNAMLGDLPTWNLSDLYSSPSGPDLDADLKRAAADADSFAKAYEGKVASLDGKTLGAAVAKFEALNDLMGRIGSYASLYYAQDMADPERGRFSQDVSQALTDIGTKLVFFRLEINKLDSADLAAKQKDPALAKYGPWLRDLRVYRPHQLSDELEKALHEKHVVGRAAWSRLFDETIARLQYPFRNEVLSEAQVLDKLSNKDAGVRKGLGRGEERRHRRRLGVEHIEAARTVFRETADNVHRHRLRGAGRQRRRSRVLGELGIGMIGQRRSDDDRRGGLDPGREVAREALVAVQFQMRPLLEDARPERYDDDRGRCQDGFGVDPGEV